MKSTVSRATTGRVKPAAIRLNYGMQRARGGGNAVRAVASLPALTGHWRHPAGGLLLSTSGAYTVDEAALYRPDLLAGRRPRTINMSTIGRDLLEADPPIEALIVYDSNPVAVAPQSSSVARGFAREDLFTVVLEQFQTDTADYADYVLPATTQLEHVDVHKSYGHYYMLANTPAIDPLGEALPNSEIFRRLAAHMGFDEPCFAESDDALAAQAFAKRGTTARLRLGIASSRRAGNGWTLPPDVRAVRARQLPDALGQVRIRCPRASQRSAPTRCPTTCRRTRARPATRQRARRFPLAIISPPARNFLNSTFVNVASLRDAEGEPALEIHPRGCGRARDRAMARGCGSSTTAAASNCRRGSRIGRVPAVWSRCRSGGRSSRATAVTRTK